MYCSRCQRKVLTSMVNGIGEEREVPRRTAPCAGYCRASAMWSDESLTGRASSAVRKDLQNVTSDMMYCLYRKQEDQRLA